MTPLLKIGTEDLVAPYLFWSERNSGTIDLSILRDEALVPEHRSVKPPPNQFTHEVRQSQPYYYGPQHAAPDSEFSAGTLVVLMVYNGGEYCRVIDAQGLYVETAYEGLRRL